MTCKSQPRDIMLGMCPIPIVDPGHCQLSVQSHMLHSTMVAPALVSNPPPGSCPSLEMSLELISSPSLPLPPSVHRQSTQQFGNVWIFSPVNFSFVVPQPPTLKFPITKSCTPMMCWQQVPFDYHLLSPSFLHLIKTLHLLFQPCAWLSLYLYPPL